MRKLALILGLMTLPLLACAADESSPAAAVTPYIAGQHYTVLSVPQPTSVSKGQIEVTEVFWYGCPHCYTLEPTVAAWLKEKPARATFVRLPAALNKTWNQHARVFYTAKALGILDELHPKIFAAMHVGGNRLATETQAAEFFEKHGVSREKFKAAYRSFGVDSQLSGAQQLARGYQLRSVPTVVVAGKYVITSTSAGGNTQMFDVVNALVEMEAK